MTELIGRAIHLAKRHPEVRGLALVGSEARGTAGADSDVDLVLLTEDIAAYTEDDGWVAEVGPAALVATRRWGEITERRLVLPSGMEVDVGIAPTSWAATEPVDPGTRRVVSGGISVLHDPDGLLKALLAAC